MLKSRMIPGKGRGLFTTERISAGEMVTNTDAIVRAGTHMSHPKCEWCGGSGRSRCTRCGIANYCSKAHQKSAWKYHQRECKYFAEVKNTEPKMDASQVRMAMQLVDMIVEAALKDAKEESVNWDTLIKEWMEIDGRVSVAGSIDTGEELPYASALHQVQNMSSYNVVPPDSDLRLKLPASLVDRKNHSTHSAGVLHLSSHAPFVVMLSSKVQRNSFGAQNEDGEQYCSALHPQIWLINHSCLNTASNCGGEDGRHLIRALVDMPPDTEITINYTRCGITSSDRNKKLRSSHQFECSCLLCKGSDIGSLRDKLLGSKRETWASGEKLAVVSKSIKTLFPTFSNCLGLPLGLLYREVEFHRLSAFALSEWPGLSLYSGDYVRSRIAFNQNILDALLKQCLVTNISHLPKHIIDFDADGNLFSKDYSAMIRLYDELLVKCGRLSTVFDAQNLHKWWQLLLCHRVGMETCVVLDLRPPFVTSTEEGNLLNYAYYLAWLLSEYHCNGISAYAAGFEEFCGFCLKRVDDFSFSRWLTSTQCAKQNIYDSHIEAAKRIAKIYFGRPCLTIEANHKHLLTM